MKEKYFKNAPDYAVGKLVAMNKCSGSLNTKSDLNLPVLKQQYDDAWELAATEDREKAAIRFVPRQQYIGGT